MKILTAYWHQFWHVLIGPAKREFYHQPQTCGVYDSFLGIPFNVMFIEISCTCGKVFYESPSEIKQPNIMNTDKDKFKFYKDEADEWRWQRFSPNGNEVGAATEGYKNMKDCEANAKRNGYDSSVHALVD
ncbi:MAG: hypothetical protein ABL951_04055 [Alphaproteobacteria bacterium]